MCLGVIDAMAVYAILVLLTKDSVVIAAVVALGILAINVVYLKPGLLPAKYLTPGLVFLFVFQIFVVLYCIYIAFTNYGSGHVSTKDDAVNALLIQNQQRVEDSAAYPVSVLEKDGALFFLVTTPDGTAEIGSADQPLEAASDAEFTGGRAAALPGYTTLNFAQLVANQATISSMAVPFSTDPNDGTLQTRDGSTAYQYVSTLVWDAAAGTMTNTQTGVVYTDNGNGSFASADGQTLATGWQVWVGVDNFVRAFFHRVDPWALPRRARLDVRVRHPVGGDDLRPRPVPRDRLQRSADEEQEVLPGHHDPPVRLPAFLSALVWQGMFNQDFGFINQSILGGASIPWLQDPLLAKVSILVVNLWLGFPYMFLVTTGAIQAIPDDIQEAGRVDGAGVWQIFRHIKFPLLLVSVAPLLISSFAFNFNNFNLIYMLTGGGPRFADASINVGASDILISMVYKVAFVGAERDYGLASAFSIIIFVLVAVISYLSFRQTKVLEELN